VSEESLPPNVVALQDRRRKKARPPPTNQGKPRIRILPGEIPRVVDESEAAMLRVPGNGVYSFGRALVQVDWEEIRVSGGGKQRVLRNHVMEAPALTERFELAAHYEKWSVQSDGWVTADCPDKVAATYLARGRWHVPSLLGISTIPVFRRDGSICVDPGYDEVSGVFFDPLGTSFLEVAKTPTKDDAHRALRSLKRLIRTFEFVSDADRSVALSAIMTATLRQAMPVAPMHAFDAPTAGSGKSMLTNVASVIATGHRAAAMSTGSDKFGDSEFEKRLSASILGGDAVISMDNMEEPLGGQLLNQMLTERLVQIRPFGRLRNVKVPSAATVFANGNNLVIVGDLTRRVLNARFDPQVERPETREFPFEPVDLALRARSYLVWCVMTIARAYMISGSRISAALGSYAEWGQLVRKPLMWLDQVDPVSVMDRTRAADPRLGRLRQVMSAWRDAIGWNNEVRTKDVIRTALEVPDEYGEDRGPKWPDLAEAVRSIAGKGDKISPDKLGWWLRKNMDRTVVLDNVGCKLVQSGGDSHGSTWQLQRLGAATAAKPDDVPF
jgi:putative DNA primase/helicase